MSSFSLRAASSVSFTGARSTSAIRFLYAWSRLNILTILSKVGASEPKPVTKYCMKMVMTVEATQKRASPAGKVIEKNINISGIITTIILPCVCWAGSAVTGVTIFCCTHIEAPTRIASGILGTDRSIQRKSLLKGSTE